MSITCNLLEINQLWKIDGLDSLLCVSSMMTLSITLYFQSGSHRIFCNVVQCSSDGVKEKHVS